MINSILLGLILTKKNKIYNKYFFKSNIFVIFYNFLLKKPLCKKYNINYKK